MTAKKAVLFFLLLIFIPLTNSTYNSSPNVQYSYEMNATLGMYKKISLKALDSTYLGKYVRGEDFCKINFTLIDNYTNEPIQGATIEVYLNSSSTDYYVGKNTTDSNGRFVLRFPIRTSYPLGPANLTAVLVEDALNGLARSVVAYYWLEIYGKLSVSLNLEDDVKPLFEKNITIYAWASLDNGAPYAQDKLNYTLEITHVNTSKKFIDHIQSGPDGSISRVFDFTSTGEGLYNVTAVLKGTNNTIQNPYLIFENQDLDGDGNVIGLDISKAYAPFTVFLASKITASFIDAKPPGSSFNAYINETVRIAGYYYDVFGNPSSTNLNLTIYYNGQPFLNLTNSSNDRGYFEFSFKPLSKGLGVGQYTLSFEDSNKSTTDISPNLVLNLFSVIRVNANLLGSSHRFMVGDNISIEGFVYDEITGDRVVGADIYLIISGEDYSSNLGDTTSLADGYFGFYNVTLSDPIKGPEANLTITVIPPSTYYNTINWQQQIEVYSYINLTIVVNRSDIYSWIITRGEARALGEENLRLTNPQNLSLTMHLQDDFNRSVISRVTIKFNNKTLISETIIGAYTFVLNANETGELYIVLDSLPPIILSITIVGQGGGFPIPSWWIWLMGGASIASLASVVLYRFRYKLLIGTFKVEPEGFEELIREIKILLENARFEEAADKIINFLRHIADLMGVKIVESQTAREILNKIYYSVEKDLYQILEDLVYVYEAVKFGHKEPDRQKLHHLIEKLPVLRHISPITYTGDVE